MKAPALWKAGLCAVSVLVSASVASADILDDIKKKGEMVVGMEVAYVPYEFFKDGEVMGYDVDLTRRFAEKLGVKVKFVDTEWAGIIPALLANKFEDAIKAKGKPGYSDYKLYDHYPEAYVDLTNKRIDGVVNALSSLQIVIKETPGKYKTVTGVQAIKAYFGMAFRLEDKQMLAFVNEQLGAMKKSGELEKLQIKWFGSTTETPNEVPKELP